MSGSTANSVEVLCYTRKPLNEMTPRGIITGT